MSHKYDGAERRHLVADVQYDSGQLLNMTVSGCTGQITNTGSFEYGQLYSAHVYRTINSHIKQRMSPKFNSFQT